MLALFDVPWMLRIGNLRVYYSVEDASEPLVIIERVWRKEGNRVRLKGMWLEPRGGKDEQ